jgi:hypothetical protein
LALSGTLSATEPITVTGPVNPPSHLFAGTLVLGKWRLRGNDNGTFHLERLDDDGAVITDAWLPVALFGFNTEINSPGLQVDNLGVTYSANMGTLAVTGDLTTTGTTRCDTFKGRAADQVTCQDNLTVEGLLVCQDGLAVAQGVTAQSIFCQGNLSVLGEVTGWSPFWIAITCNINGNILNSKGRYTPTVSRVGADTGYNVGWTVAHPDGSNYVVTTGSQEYHTFFRFLARTSLTVYVRNASNIGSTGTDGIWTLTILA